MVAAPSVLRLASLWRSSLLLLVLFPLAVDVSRSASATEEALLRRRFAVIDLGRSFVSPFEVPSIFGFLDRGTKVNPR